MGAMEYTLLIYGGFDVFECEWDSDLFYTPRDHEPYDSWLRIPQLDNFDQRKARIYCNARIALANCKDPAECIDVPAKIYPPNVNRSAPKHIYAVMKQDFASWTLSSATKLLDR